MRRSVPVMLLIILFCSPDLGAQDIDSLFHRANAAFRGGDFAGAVAGYQAILDQGVESAQVQYNLGNAYYRLGRVGGAIAAYERAARLAPTNGDILHNLELTRLRTLDRIEPVPELFLITWVRRLNAALPVTATRSAFLFGWALTFLSLFVIYLGRGSSFIRFGRPFFFGGMIIAVVCGALLGLQTYAVPEHPEAIVMMPTVTAKTSPDGQSTDAFVIHEGLKVEVGDSVEGWVRITLADGKTGWVQQTEIEQL